MKRWLPSPVFVRLLVCGWVLSCCAAAAHAETVAVLPPERSSDSVAQARQAVVDVIRDDAALEPMADVDISLAELLAVSGCDRVEPECLAAVRDTLGADSFVWFVAAAEQGTVSAHWYRGDGTREVAREVGSPDDATILAALLLQPERGVVRVRTVEGAVVEVDGAPASAVTTAPPGSVRVAVSAPGYASEVRDVNVVAGDLVEVDIALEPAAGDSDVSEPIAPPDDGVSGLAVAGWVSTGVGAALLVGSAVTFSQVGAKEDELADVLARQPLRRDDISEAEDLRDSGESLATITDALLFAGLGLVGVGATLLIVDWTTADAAAPSVSLDVGITGASMTARF